MKKFLKRYDYIVKYKGNSFIETIFFAIVLIVICFLFGISHTKAASVPLETFEFSFGGVHYPEFPINWSISKNDSVSKQLSIIGLGEEIIKYDYVILEICSNNKLEIEVTGSCNSSCFTRGDAYIYHSSKPCKAMNLNGTISLYEIRTETFEKNINGSAEYKIVSPMSFKNKNDSIAAVRLNDIILSTEDILSGKIEEQALFDKLHQAQQQTNDKLNDLKDKQNQTNQKLDEINNADISSGDKELPNTDSFDNYQESEGALLDKVKEANFDNLSIGMDLNSSNFVWNTLTSFIQSHSAVFGMFIAILSIGIIKLALGR